jgi:hypothetical protein
MANFDRLPEILPLAHTGEFQDIETAVVGERIDVGVYRTTGRKGSFSEPAHQLVGETATEVLRRLGYSGDQSLAMVCGLVARAAIGRLVTSEGFEVRHGTYSDYTERVDVQLRPPEPIDRQAQVTRHQAGEQ